MLGVLLITNKLKYIKYVAPLAVLGTLMALLSPDLTMEVYFDKNVSQSDLDALSAQKIFLSGRDQYINFKVEEVFKLRW
ncbi:Integral membrane protein (intg_mem_TP0381), partial [Mycoplasmopsis synoviae]